MSSTSIATYFRVIDGVRVRFADNKTDADITVLLLRRGPSPFGRSVESGTESRPSGGSSPSTCRGSATPTVARN